MTDARSLKRVRPAFPLAMILALLPLFGTDIALGQSLDAQPFVCVNDEFDVEWTGPDGSGDTITIALPATGGEEDMGSVPTGQGNPATLRAPVSEGLYEIRYVSGGSSNILEHRGIAVRNCDVTSITTGPGIDSPGEALMVAGVQTSYGDMINQNQTSPLGTFSAQDLCAASGTVGWAMGQIIDRIEQSMQEVGSPIMFDDIERLPGAPTRAGIEESLGAARDGFCNQGTPAPLVEPFVITYAYCRMAMVTPNNAMDIHLPPGIGSGQMSMADFGNREVVKLTLRRSLGAAEAVLGGGQGGDVIFSSPTPAGNRIGYPTTRYEFEYAGSPGTGIPMMGNAISVTNKGSVFVSDDVPGIDIVRTFYENLTNEVMTEDGSMSFFEGLIKNLVGMLREGLPLEIDQTITSSIMGRTSVSGRTHSIITGIQLVEFDPAWCSQSLMPPNYPVTDIDQQISDVMSQSGTSSAEIAQGMQEYERAMQEMTPEERQMMEQFSMGDMLQNMMGGTNPAAAGAAAPAPAATPSPAVGGSNMPPASELQSGNLTESVQRHLQALGYDVGETNGEMSMSTTIAISTFQAEKDMEVTGEVSPQLLGILSAEVDSRR